MTRPKVGQALAALLAACLLIVAGGCGGTGATTSDIQRAPAKTSQDVTDQEANIASDSDEDDSASAGRINPTLDLCTVSKLNELASDLFPGHDVKCHPMPGKRTETTQAQGATWAWGKVKRGVIQGSQDMMQVILDGKEPRDTPGEVTDMPDLDESCPEQSESLRCDDKSLRLSGSRCLLRTLSVSLGGKEYTSHQMSCYIGRDPETGLDVQSYTAASGVDAADVEDFTAAAIDAARG